MTNTNTTVAARLPPSLYSRFMQRIKKLGMSRSEALVSAVEMWLSSPPEPQQPQQQMQMQVPQIIIVVPPIIQGSISTPQVLSSIPQRAQFNQSNLQVMTSPQQVRKEEAALVVPRSALIEPESKGEAEAVREELLKNKMDFWGHAAFLYYLIKK